ncbi:hypothetical protein [Priestia megaterium]|uniref:hypothetical protein n=1 Tax=Priestia megaterium TaxID=1404 RepID=UPI00196B5172|nr:hypothetical protein [Priestia megaterium]QSF41534.1 hypothetical protein ICR96_13015 [Priestia megaterium]
MATRKRQRNNRRNRGSFVFGGVFFLFTLFSIVFLLLNTYTNLTNQKEEKLQRNKDKEKVEYFINNRLSPTYDEFHNNLLKMDSRIKLIDPLTLKQKDDVIKFANYRLNNLSITGMSMVSTSHNERPLFDGRVYAFYILLPSSDNQVNSNEVKRLVFNVNSALNKKVSEGEISILLDKLQKKANDSREGYMGWADSYYKVRNQDLIYELEYNGNGPKCLNIDLYSENEIERIVERMERLNEN